jgi:hypothetical protein
MMLYSNVGRRWRCLPIASIRLWTWLNEVSGQGWEWGPGLLGFRFRCRDQTYRSPLSLFRMAGCSPSLLLAPTVTFARRRASIISTSVTGHLVPGSWPNITDTTTMSVAPSGLLT